MGKSSVSVLGIFHLKEDVLEPRRQQEIKACVERIKHYRPTKIALEVMVGQDAILNKEYKKYVANDFPLDTKWETALGRGSFNEVYQLGFRIAAELGHDRVYATDWMEDIGNRDIGTVVEFAEQHQPEIYAEIKAWFERWPWRDGSIISITELLKDMNNPEFNLYDHQIYMRLIALIGEGEEYVGIDWMRWWYQRNLIIYANIAQLATSADERILVIYGHSHNYLLNQFFSENGSFELVSPLTYLDL